MLIYIYIYNYYVSVFFIIPKFFATGAVTSVWTNAIMTGAGSSARAFMTGDSLDLQRFEVQTPAC